MTEVAVFRDDVTLRGTATGTGPSVLLLHAGGEHRGVWTPVAAVLTQRGLRTVAFDLRGHGDSPGPATALREIAEDVTAMIRREPAPVVVAGASLGGLAAIVALADPSAARHVAGLVLVDVVPDPDPARTRGLARRPRASARTRRPRRGHPRARSRVPGNSHDDRPADPPRSWRTALTTHRQGRGAGYATPTPESQSPRADRRSPGGSCAPEALAAHHRGPRLDMAR